MGCVSSKSSAVKDGDGIPPERAPSKRLYSPASSTKEGDSQMMKGVKSSKTSLIDEKTSNSVRLDKDQLEKSRVNPEGTLVNYVSFNKVPKAREGEQVAAGWPSWLAVAAGEAINGLIPRRADNFLKLEKIGEGTYSSVYKARDLLNGKTVALKRVRFDNLDTESVRFMSREIAILRRLDHPNIIKLEGVITSSVSTSLYLIFEYMEHDLTGLASLPGLKFTEPQVKCYMQQLLSGLEHCHSNGVLHRDIKGSNLLIDDRGILKIADFGLATFFNPHKIQPLTSRVVTLWYRPPELLLGDTCYGVSVDLWSAGCILGELYAGRPIMPGRTEVEQLHKIFKLCGSPPEEYWDRMKQSHPRAFRPQKPYRRRVAERFQDISSPALALIEILLSADPASRGTATSALNNKFFMTEPLACDPSTLPKYPPSKEIDARRREEETRRRQTLEGRGNRISQARPGIGIQGNETTSSAKANAEILSSFQKMKFPSQSKTRNELLASRQKESTSGPMLDSARNSHTAEEANEETYDRVHRQGLHSGPLTRGRGWPNAEDKFLFDRPSFSRIHNSSTLSSLAPKRTSTVEGSQAKLHIPQNKRAVDAAGRFSGPINYVEGTQDSDWLDYSGSFTQFDRKASIRKPSNQSYAPDDGRMHLSGPLLHPSNNLDQMLKEHDRKIQEVARRARLEKFRHSKVRAR